MSVRNQGWHWSAFFTGVTIGVLLMALLATIAVATR